MVVAHNIVAMNAQRQFNIVGTRKNKKAERLSSGYRINRAADDAAGLSISEGMRRQIRGLDQGASNIQDGISLIQVADGAYQEVQEMLHRMTELSVQAANGINSEQSRQAIQAEINQLVTEIDRIGKDTRFNNLQIFDDMYGEDVEGSVTQLITSSAAESGYLTDAIKVNGTWFPAATIDFSGINSKNIGRLDGQGFSFCCSRGCSEVFEFVFHTDGTASAAKNLSGKVHHVYDLDISKCKSGSDILDTMFSFVKANPPYNNDSETTNMLPGALCVSHSNNMARSADGNSIIIYANRTITSYGSFSSTGFATEAEAKKAYPSKVSGIGTVAGSIDCSNLTKVVEDEKINEIPIQCSGEVDDSIMLHTHRMNATLIGVSSVNVLSEIGAKNALGIIADASEKISTQRAELGAFQNRLEHTYNANRNTSENTQAAESRVRDADMAKEMMELSRENILEQVGNAMISQANQQPEGVLALLK